MPRSTERSLPAQLPCCPPLPRRRSPRQVRPSLPSIPCFGSSHTPDSLDAGSPPPPDDEDNAAVGASSPGKKKNFSLTRTIGNMLKRKDKEGKDKDFKVPPPLMSSSSQRDIDFLLMDAPPSPSPIIVSFPPFCLAFSWNMNSFSLFAAAKSCWSPGLTPAFTHHSLATPHRQLANRHCPAPHCYLATRLLLAPDRKAQS